MELRSDDYIDAEEKRHEVLGEVTLDKFREFLEDNDIPVDS
jgi:hypothetical protein